MATSSLSFSTPSPPGSIRTPGTPKHGYSDSWVPFSPRKSARISSRQPSTNRTPSPRAFQKSTRSSATSSTTFSTPANSPQKKRLPAMDSVRRASNNLTAEGTVNTSDALGLGPKLPQQKPQVARSSHAGTMLPTPSKTPCKQPNAKVEAASRDIARDIFAPGNTMKPSTKKKAKRYTGLTLDSFRADDADDSIEIFTDSRDRIPEVDDSAENPFYGDQSVAEPIRRRSKRKSVVIPGAGKQSVDDAVRRDDGVLVVFRGKKIFRKFSECNDAESGSQQDEESDLESNDQIRHRPMTRSSIKPRLLFPAAGKGKQVANTTDEDEEALTDIEDHASQDAQGSVPKTPTQLPKQKVETPDAPRFAPASPPSTGRVTRSADKSLKKEGKVQSPFDSWRRSKSRASLQGQKREGEPLVKNPAGSKRQRS
ncbi:hypothetical protein GGR50DRAFT_683536 [Xylaria sp. CBS 124048]|nr:hypothetical protein GGR50DRAFT_683536 [Xylaria sp. CBS 124048]